MEHGKHDKNQGNISGIKQKGRNLNSTPPLKEQILDAVTHRTSRKKGPQ